MVIKFNNTHLEALAKDESVHTETKFDKFTFKKALKILQGMPDVQSLRALGSLHFENLADDMKDLYAIRVGPNFKLIFAIEKDNMMFNNIIIIKELLLQRGILDVS